MVYLLHYESKLAHAQHYIGWYKNKNRIRHHANGTSGAHLPQAFFEQGITFVVAKTWEGDRNLERSLKKRKDARSLCPICKPARRKAQANWKHDHSKAHNVTAVLCSTCMDQGFVKVGNDVSPCPSCNPDALPPDGPD